MIESLREQLDLPDKIGGLLIKTYALEEHPEVEVGADEGYLRRRLWIDCAARAVFQAGAVTAMPFLWSGVAFIRENGKWRKIRGVTDGYYVTYLDPKYILFCESRPEAWLEENELAIIVLEEPQ